MYFTNAFTLGGMFASFAFFDSLAATFRGQEDPFNPVFGGLGMGLFLGSIRGVYMGYVGWSVYAGAGKF